MKNKFLPLVFIIGIIFFLIFVILQNTVEYSLYEIKKSIEEHDVITFQKFVDVDGILDNFIEDFKQHLNEYMLYKQEESDNEWAALGIGLVNTFAPMVINNYKTTVKNKILKQIEEPSFNKDDVDSGVTQDFGLKKVQNLDNLDLKNIFAQKYQKKVTGKTAKVTILKGNAKIIITFRNMPERYWRVVRIEISDLFNFKNLSQEKKLEEKKNEEMLTKEEAGSRAANEAIENSAQNQLLMNKTNNAGQEQETKEGSARSRQYVIQVAEYADEEAAKVFVDELKGKGFSVAVETIYRGHNQEKPYSKVNVGSFDTFDEAKRFNEEFKVKTNIGDSFIKEKKKVAPLFNK